MDLTAEQIAELEAALSQLAELDPGDLPEPAANLARTLSAILEDSEDP